MCVVPLSLSRLMDMLSVIIAPKIPQLNGLQGDSIDNLRADVFGFAQGLPEVKGGDPAGA